jgi:hypothetical protein
MLGDMIIDRDSEIDKLKKEIVKLKSAGELPYIDYLN